LIAAIDAVREALTTHQRSPLATSPESYLELGADPLVVADLKQSLAVDRSEIFARVVPSQLQTIDAATIDLIGMLFEYMLDDPLLPNCAKALLSRLHTPYLKLSLVDRELLIDSEHPARLLLDALVAAGGRWVSDEDPRLGVFPSMSTVVDRVLQANRPDRELFRALNADFGNAVEEYQRRVNTTEARTQEAVQGRERLQLAKQRATQVIEERTSGISLPDPVARFFSGPWQDRLVFILLRLGGDENSSDWREALTLADDLVDLFRASSRARDTAAIRRTGSAIVRKITGALQTLGDYHDHGLEGLFRILDDPAEVVAWRDRRAATPTPASPRSANTETGSVVPLPTGSRREQPDAAPADSVSQAMLERVRALDFGTWLELPADGNRRRRLKLSWLSPRTDTCMFVDKSGTQADLRSVTELARLLSTGEAEVLEDRTMGFVERALHALKQILQGSGHTTE
jgi:hypothetical protein